MGELTLTNVQWPTNFECVPSIDKAFAFTAPFTGSADETSKAITATVSSGSNNLSFKCTELKSDDTSLSCTYDSGSAVNGDYKVSAIAETDGGNTFVVTGIQDKTFTYNDKYVSLKSTATSTQTINYKNESPYTFTITYASALSDDKKPSKVIASATTPKEFTDCTYKEAVVTCTVTKETLPVGEYTVKVINACGKEEGTGITLKVVEEGGSTSNSSYLKLSIFALFGIFLL